MSMREGQFRNPSGCAVTGVIDRSGRSMSGQCMIDAIAVMHDRSNGLGGGFAGYGIYPHYKDHYAFHLFTIPKRRRRIRKNSSGGTSRSCIRRRSPPAKSRR